MGLTEPRKSEDWKIQKRKGFMKDRESKLKDIKLSKTKKRNSNEPLVPRLSVKEKEKETNDVTHGDVDMFEFLEGLDDDAAPVPAPTQTKTSLIVVLL